MAQSFRPKDKQRPMDWKGREDYFWCA